MDSRFLSRSTFSLITPSPQDSKTKTHPHSNFLHGDTQTCSHENYQTRSNTRHKMRLASFNRGRSGCTYGPTDGPADGGTYGRTDLRTEGQTLSQRCEDASTTQINKKDTLLLPLLNPRICLEFKSFNCSLIWFLQLNSFRSSHKKSKKIAKCNFAKPLKIVLFLKIGLFD